MAYCLVLKREVDIDGLKYYNLKNYNETHSQKLNLVDLFTQLFTSVEARGESLKGDSIDNADVSEFVDALYLRILNRSTSSDLVGKEYWVDKINSGGITKFAAIREFLFSPEFKTNRGIEMSEAPIE